MSLPGLYQNFAERWNKYQTAWIISDLHFGEDDLKEGFPDRPSDEDLVKNINKKVGANDILFILGDVGDIEYIKKLRGYKVLIMGNHDKGRSNYERKIIRTRLMNPLTIDNGWDSLAVEIDNQLFDEVYEGPIMVGEKLLLSHEPVEINWAYNIHGHEHKPISRENSLNVNADVINYEPINLTKLLKTGLTKDITSLHRQTINKAVEKRNNL